MKIEDIIEKRILEEAQKISERYQHYHNYLELTYQRSLKRINSPPSKVVKKPIYWDSDNKFNPFYVIKHSRPISISIARKIKKRIYKPNEPYIFQVPKADGKFRDVSVYQIPDAAISNWIYDNLMAKNKHRFSSYSYAYRNGRNVHFAIQDISVDLRYYARIFIAEFDFTDFFGSINHNYLYDQFNKNGFFIANQENLIIKSFLEPRAKGVPQGTSISLFLANMACWKMDKDFELNGLKFARYADDTIIWSNDYDKICKSFEIINEFSRNSGVNINPKKSKGISLLSRQGLSSEFGETKHFFNFIGYKISVDQVSIKDEVVKKIKQHISYILYKNLLQPLKITPLRALVIPSNNRDQGFLVAIQEIRRYLYGNLTENHIKDYLRGLRRRINIKGIMSYYPLLDDANQLKSLDGWLLSTIYRCLKLRAQLLHSHGYNRFNQFPFNLTRDELLRECRLQLIDNKKLIQIPSFLRIYEAIKKKLTDEGIDQTMNPGSELYDYSI
jgi:RNA-directed DNA polymerase